MTRLSFSRSGHAYWLADEAGRKRRIPSVTTLLNQLGKPALVNWAARVAADYAVDHWDTLTGQPISERREAIRTAHEANRGRAAAKGTHIHALAEDLLAGRPVQVPPEAAAQVEGLAKWLDTQQVQVRAAERRVWSDDDPDLGLCAYAGTFDAIVDHPHHGRMLIDWKTGNGVWPEMGLQLAGYAAADWHVVGDVDVPSDQTVIGQAAIVSIRPEGTSLHLLTPEQLDAGHRIFELLRSLKGCEWPAFQEVIA